MNPELCVSKATTVLLDQCETFKREKRLDLMAMMPLFVCQENCAPILIFNDTGYSRVGDYKAQLNCTKQMTMLNCLSHDNDEIAHSKLHFFRVRKILYQWFRDLDLVLVLTLLKVVT